MKKLFFFLLFLFFILSSRAQNTIDFSRDWIDTNLFHNVQVTFVGDWFSSPVKMDTTGTWPDGVPSVDPRFSFGIGLVSIAYEPRLNIYNYYDYISLSVSAPITVSFSAVGGQISGVGHVHVPLMLEGNFFGQSTYNAYDEKGFSVGLGARYTFAPVYVIDDGNVKRHWLTPQARLGYKWENYYGDQRMAYLSFGFAKAYKYRVYSASATSGYKIRTTLSRFCFLFTVGQAFDW